MNITFNKDRAREIVLSKYKQYLSNNKIPKNKRVSDFTKFKKWRTKYPEKNKAHKIVFSAKRNGTLKQLPCFQCGNTKSEAHHEDYSKPLDVIWLCKQHHVIADLLQRERNKISL